MPKLWIDNATIRTYDEARNFFHTARNKDAGKPLRSWAVLKRNGEDYVVHMKNYNGYNEVGRFKPNNTFVFSMSISYAKSYSVTLSQALYGALPFWWNRVGTGRYEVASIPDVVSKYDGGNNRQVYHVLKELAVPYHEGLTFDLTTNKATNAQMLDTQTVVPEKRKEWLRALKVYKRSMYTKVKLGIVDSVLTELVTERKNTRPTEWPCPDWHAEHWNERLYTAVKNNDTSLEMIKLFAMSTRYSLYRGMVISDVVQAFDAIMAEQSINLRRRFGVFG